MCSPNRHIPTRYGRSTLSSHLYINDNNPSSRICTRLFFFAFYPFQSVSLSCLYIVFTASLQHGGWNVLAGFRSLTRAGARPRERLGPISFPDTCLWFRIAPRAPSRAGGRGAFDGGEGGDGDAGRGEGPYSLVAGVQRGAGRERIVHEENMAGRCEDRRRRFRVKPGMTGRVSPGMTSKVMPGMTSKVMPGMIGRAGAGVIPVMADSDRPSLVEPGAPCNDKSFP